MLNIKVKLYSIIFLFVLFFFRAQTVLLPHDSKLKIDSFVIERYGKAQYNVIYEVEFTPNTANLRKKNNVSLLLQSNGKISKFFDPNTLKRDSLLQDYQKKDNVGSDELNQLLKIKVKSDRIILKDFTKNLIVVENKYRKRYQYDELLPTLVWKIEKETKLILEQQCQKATTYFRGRLYTAWFAQNITLNDGPDLFHGLPGLILEISDSQEHFHFKAIAIVKNENEINMLNYKNKIKLSREKFRILQKNYFDNPGFDMGTAFNPDGTQIKIPSIPYNPLELE